MSNAEPLGWSHSRISDMETSISVDRRESEKCRFSFQEVCCLTGGGKWSSVNRRLHAGLRYPAIVMMYLGAGNPLASGELEQIKDRRMDTLHKEQGSCCANSMPRGRPCWSAERPKGTELGKADRSDGCGVVFQACLLQEHSWNSFILGTASPEQ